MTAKDEILTIQDYIFAQATLEQQAIELLPGDATLCFHSRGSIRQRIYSCLTCVEILGRHVGVCYACFVSCHTTHDIVELFFKRNFQCDCGIYGSHCSIDPIPKSITANTYSIKNFNGLFCTCSQLYDAETETRTMFECCICEDWFHESCIGNVPDEDNFDEFICGQCVERHPFLKVYGELGAYIDPLDKEGLVEAQVVNEEVLKLIGSDCNVEAALSVQQASLKPQGLQPCNSNDPILSEMTAIVEVASSMDDLIVDHLVEAGPTAVSTLAGLNKYEAIKCILPKTAAPIHIDRKHLFCKQDWHSLLCKCLSCLQLYQTQKISFIIEDEEEVEALPVSTSILS